jgi:hypothetical protein
MQSSVESTLNETVDKVNDLYSTALDKSVKNYNYVTFTNIDDIEEDISCFLDNRFLFDSSFFSQLISCIDEKTIIKRIRTMYENLNIKFKTHHKVEITIQTENFPLTISRYFLTPKTADDARRLMDLSGKRGIYPFDIALGLDRLPHLMTVRAMLNVSKVALESSSYKDASARLKNYYRMEIDPVTVMSVTNHIGELAFQHEIERANKTYDSIFTDRGSNVIFPKDKKDGILYIEMDGAFLNTRNESETVKSARNESETVKSSFRENKLGLVFSSQDKRAVQKKASNINENMNISEILQRPRYNLISKDYCSYVGSVDTFKKLLLDNAIRNGYGHYRETVLVSDGATWIRNLKEEIFWDAQQILDYFHLCEKVGQFGKTYFKVPTISTKHDSHKIDTHSVEEKELKDNANYQKFSSWQKDMCLKLLESRHNEIMDEILKMESSPIIKDNKLSRYIINNSDNIDYYTYIKKGYDIGSGAIESANKSVLKKRMCGPGMRWLTGSAQKVITLLVKLHSNKWFEDVVIPVRRHYNIG